MTDPVERLRLIATIVEKDLRIRPWIWAMTGIVAATGFFLMLPAALSAAYYASQFPWTWYDGSLRPYYAIYAAVSSLLLGLTFAGFHRGEIHRGTIRSIILYPVDMNDITFAKLLSSLVLTAILSTILFLGFFGGYFFLRVFPAGDFLRIHATALLASFLALSVGVFLSHGLAHVAGRMVVSPTALGTLFLLLAILLTETVLTALGLQIVALGVHTQGRLPGPDDYALVEGIAKSLSVLSPHHAAARSLGVIFRITQMWVDVHVVAPVAVAVVAGGYLAGKKLFLDVFVR
jgi:ABC-type transport system involved in multi-copper enzyme maturation permease subunit